MIFYKYSPIMFKYLHHVLEIKKICLTLRKIKQIMNTSDITIEPLLTRRLIDLEGRDFLQLAMYAFSSVESHSAPAIPIQAIGITALAQALSCSVSQISTMRRDGVLDDCVISNVGRHIVFDVDKARAAANAWKSKR